MSKTKAGKVGKGANKPVDKTLTKVKDAGVTKPSQSPKAKSKEMARKVIAKEEKAQRKQKKKEPTPSSSESDSDEKMDSSSSSDSESEEEKPVKGAKAPKSDSKTKEEESDSDSDSGSDEDMNDASSSESESEEEKPAKAVPKKDSKKAEPKAAESSESDSDSNSDESSDEVAPKVAPKKEAKANSSDSEESGSDSDSESDDEAPAKASAEKESSEEDSDESDSEGSSDSDSEEESAQENKKRKANDEPAPAEKKSKSTDGGATNLFVGNLSWNIDEAWLTSEFESFGELAGVRIVTERDSGRSRGFGYVEYANSADAAKAYEGMKGAEIDGRKINVDYASERPANNQAGGFKDRANARAKSFGDQTSPESDTLFVGNIPFDATEDSLRDVFAEKGSVMGIRLPTDAETGRPKGFGYVQYASVDEARKALNDLHGAEINGRPMRLDFSTPKPAGGREFGGGRGGRGGRGGGRGGFGGRGGRGGRGGFGDRGGRGGSAAAQNRGSITEYKGTKVTF